MDLNEKKKETGAERGSNQRPFGREPSEHRSREKVRREKAIKSSSEQWLGFQTCRLGLRDGGHEAASHSARLWIFDSHRSLGSYRVPLVCLAVDFQQDASSPQAIYDICNEDSSMTVIREIRVNEEVITQEAV